MTFFLLFCHHIVLDVLHYKRANCLSLKKSAPLTHSAGASLNEPPPRTVEIFPPQFSDDLFRYRVTYPQSYDLFSRHLQQVHLYVS